MDYKNNHYVAQGLLKRFMGKSGELFYFDKRSPGDPIIHRNPKTIFSENHLYTARDQDGNPDVSLERDVYKKLDNAANIVIDKIVSSSRVGQPPNLSLEERATWDSFVVHQWQRTPDFHNKLPIFADRDTAIREAIDRYEALFGPASEEDRNLLHSEAEKAQIHQGGKVAALKLLGPRVLAALSSRGIGIARIRDASQSFIIGSLPIARFQRPGQTLADPEVEAWFPIAHDIAVTPYGPVGSEMLIDIDDVHVAKINWVIFNQSTEVASRSSALLHSMAGIE